MAENLALQEMLRAAAANAVIDLFAPLELSLHVRQGHARPIERPLTAVVGLSGVGIVGSLLVKCARRVLIQTHPTQADDNEALRDWLGEIGNLVVGRFKQPFLRKKIVLSAAPPSVMDDANAFALFIERGNHVLIDLATSDGKAAVSCLVVFDQESEVALAKSDGNESISIPKPGSVFLK